MTFKSNCPDIRNSKVFELIKTLKEENCTVKIHDPLADPDEVLATENLHLSENLSSGGYDAVIICVGHDVYRLWGVQRLKQLCKPDGVLLDPFSLFDELHGAYVGDRIKY